MDTPQGTLQRGTRRTSSSVPQRAFTTGSTREDWALLTDMDSAALLAGAKKIRGCTILDSPPIFESGGREESLDPTNRDRMGEG